MGGCGAECGYTAVWGSGRLSNWWYDVVELGGRSGGVVKGGRRRGGKGQGVGEQDGNVQTGEDREKQGSRPSSVIFSSTPSYGLFHCQPP